MLSPHPPPAMSKKPGFYAVKIGRRPGVYFSWCALFPPLCLLLQRGRSESPRGVSLSIDSHRFHREDCSVEVTGFPGAEFRKFSSREEAQEFVQAPARPKFPIPGPHPLGPPPPPAISSSPFRAYSTTTSSSPSPVPPVVTAPLPAVLAPPPAPVSTMELGFLPVPAGDDQLSLQCADLSISSFNLRQSALRRFTHHTFREKIDANRRAALLRREQRQIAPAPAPRTQIIDLVNDSPADAIIPAPVRASEPSL